MPAISTSSLPATLCPLYLYIHVCILTRPADTLAHRPPHNHLCSLISDTHQANDIIYLRGALFHLQNASEPRRKRAPPQTYVFYFLFLHPIRVTAMSTSPHTSTLCHQLHHFQLHLCSLIRNTQQASDLHFFKDPLFHLQNAPKPGRKPPQTNVHILLSVLVLSGWPRYQLHRMKVLFPRYHRITSSSTSSR